MISIRALLILLLLVSGTFAWDLAKAFASTDTGGNVNAMAFSNDNKKVVVGNPSGVVKAYSTSDTYAQLNKVTLEGAVLDIKANPKKNVFAVCTDKFVYLLNADTLATVAQTAFPNGQCKDLQWEPQGNKLVAVGQVSGLVNYVKFNGQNLNVLNTYETQFTDNTAIYDSSINPNGTTVALAGAQGNNKTASNVLSYDLSTGQYSTEVNIPTSYMNAQKILRFSPSGQQLIVGYKDTKLIEVYKYNNGNYQKQKELVFDTNVVDTEFLPDGSLAVLRENGTAASVVDFVSIGDSQGSSIVYTGHVYADKGKPKYLEISPDGSVIGIAFQGSGVNLYKNNTSSEVYVPVVAAVVGAVVVGSVASVGAAGAAAAAGSVGAQAGIIGTAPVAQGVSQMASHAASHGAKMAAETGKFML